MFEQFGVDLTQVLGEADSFDTALAKLEALTDHSFLEGFAGWMIESLQAAESIGRSGIVELDAAMSDASDEVIGRDADDHQWIVCDDVVRVSFDLIPKEALDILRLRAFTIAGVEHDSLIQELRDRLLKALREGETFEQFVQRAHEIFDSFGVTRLADYRIQTVYRTNMFTAYAVGQLNQAVSMVDRFPFWRYSAILDARTRASHRALDGRVFKTGEGPVPPIDYNCRCTAIYLHKSQATGLTASTWADQAALVKFDTLKEFGAWAATRRESLRQGTKDWIAEVD